MNNTAPNEDVRLVRILAPGGLLREVDKLVHQGRGGYQTRQEFFLDAIENQVLEVKYSGAANGARGLPVDRPTRETPEPERPTNGTSDGEASARREAPQPPALANGESVRMLIDFSETELHTPVRGPVLETGLAVAPDEPLFGLHNRDYPSIWAAHQLVRQTEDGFVLLQKYLETAVNEAWRFAESLKELDKQTSVKLTALLPKNLAKPQSAEESFKAFAIGVLAKTPLEDGKLRASGPLYTWRVAQVRREGEALGVGLTEAGYDLLERLDGISLRLPHEPEFAERFLDFLRQHAPADAAGFHYLLDVVPEGLTRVELADRFKDWRPDWSDTEANTYAAAYVARAREWGLLEQKLVDRRYALTEFGERQRAKATA